MIKIEDTIDWDVIIVGAGLGGLICGGILSHSGYKVLILEKHSIVGGYCTNFKRKDFIFDSSLHMTSAVEEGDGIHDILKEFDANDCVDWIKLDEICEYRSPSMKLKIPANINEFSQILCEKFPKESENIEKFFSDQNIVNGFLQQLNLLNNSETIKQVFKKIGKMGKFIKTVSSTLNELMDKYELKDKNLRSIISSLYCYFGTRPEKLCGLTFNAGFVTLLTKGAYYPKGGSGAFTDAIAKKIESYGGKILTNTEVSKIDIKNNGSNQVMTSKGECFNGKYIVSNASLPSTIHDLIGEDKFPKSYLKKLQEMIISLSIIEVWLGLDIDVKTLGLDAYEYIIVDPDLTSDGFDKIIDEGDYSKMTEFLMTIYSNLDPDQCPPGKSIVSCACLANYSIFEKLLSDEGKRAEKYKEFKEKITAQVISKIESSLGIPDLEKHIEVKVCGTPLTLERYTNNTNGSILGWEFNPKQVAKGFSNKSPLNNLYLCGQWIKPGGSVMAVMISGYKTAKLIKKELSS